MQNFDEGAPHSPHSADDGISLVQRELLSCFEKLGMEYGLDQRDLPLDVLAALTRYLNGNLHPSSVAEFCATASGILGDMGKDMAEIATEARGRCH